MNHFSYPKSQDLLQTNPASQTILHTPHLGCYVPFRVEIIWIPTSLASSVASSVVTFSPTLPVATVPEQVEIAIQTRLMGG